MFTELRTSLKSHVAARLSPSAKEATRRAMRAVGLYRPGPEERFLEHIINLKHSLQVSFKPYSLQHNPYFY